MIADYDNLQLACWKASKGKRTKGEVRRFYENIHEELTLLRNGILHEDIRIGDYHYFEISEPKKRQICAASFRERVLHHAIINIYGPYFDKYLISDTYACRKGKGSHKAVSRAQFFSSKNSFYLKLDIAKYFHSINHEVLVRLLEQKFKEKRFLGLLKRIIESFEISTGRGVPIGNLTSQYFANYYLGFLDHFIKEQLCIKSYVRYMDDFIVWSNNKNDLKDCLESIRRFVNSFLLLKLNNTVNLNYTSKGVSFLGYRVFPQTIKLAKRSRDRFVKKYCIFERQYLSNMWDERELADHMSPLIAFTKHAGAKSFRNSVIQRFGAVS